MKGMAGTVWLQGWITCRACRQHWVAVRPDGSLALQCPDCGAMAPVQTDPLPPPLPDRIKYTRRDRRRKKVTHAS